VTNPQFRLSLFTPFWSPIRARAIIGLVLVNVACTLTSFPKSVFAADYVIHISVDGLRPDAITTIGPVGASNFYRFRNEGAFTDNARTDYNYTITLPNHTSQLTGRPVNNAFGPQTGHHYVDNGDPPPTIPPTTLATNAGYYIASAFDIAHDNGLKTGLYATKTKFSLYDTSYDSTNGALDLTGIDNGRDKIDVSVVGTSSSAIISSLTANMGASATRTNYTFVHLHNPDTAGHGNAWDLSEPPTSAYLDAVRTVNGYLGQIFSLVAATPELNGHTAIILSADHGGVLDTNNHVDETNVGTYTIPFYVWGNGVSHGDLYAMNLGTRLNPGTGRPLYSDVLQPIRNGEMANLGLDLLGLGPVPGSSINFNQNLIVPEPSTAMLVGIGCCVLLIQRIRRPGLLA
jgi:hypothetical protein